MSAYVQDADLTIHVGDCLQVLGTLEDGSVDCVVTSPPYWGLRDYSVDGQLGLEPTPDQYVTRMVAVFREVRRVLAPHGTCWVNLGDSYAAGKAARADGGLRERPRTLLARGAGGSLIPSGYSGATAEAPSRSAPPGYKPKDLVGIPWRIAFALQADGWYLRSDIIWAKPNPMPESVTDRPTKAHEYVFLLSKGPRYWFDSEAIREPQTSADNSGRPESRSGVSRPEYEPHRPDGPLTRERIPMRNREWNPAGRNARTVWEIATQPYAGAHFATYPEELVRRCVLAGCPEWVCRVCGVPRTRIVEVESSWRSRAENGAIRGNLAPEGFVGAGTQRAVHGAGVSHDLDSRRREVKGWSDCGHNNYRPGIVLDPFLGSGTTALVARKHGRHSIGIELNEEYARLAAERTRQLSLLGDAV